MYDELFTEQLRSRASWLDFAVPTKTDGKTDAKLMRKAADAIEDLITALNASNEVIAKSKPRWIPVTERLPEKNQEVLIFLFGEDPYIAWHNGEYWCTEDFRLDEPDDWQPTYWFPLPQPPKDGES